MKLEIKHIQHYPIGGDNALSITDGKEIKRVDGIYTFDNKKEFWFKSGGWNLHCKSWEPILHPMSDLYKEIYGVVGIVELAKTANPDWDEYTDPKIEEEFGSYYVEFKNWNGAYEGCPALVFNPNNMYFARYVDGEGWEGIPNILNLYDYLFTYHYDVFGLIDKGLAIDINTIK